MALPMAASTASSLGIALIPMVPIGSAMCAIALQMKTVMPATTAPSAILNMSPSSRIALGARSRDTCRAPSMYHARGAAVFGHVAPLHSIGHSRISG